jgi:transposase
VGELKLAERGGKRGTKRAIVAVARELAVLLYHLWISCEEYEPLNNRRKRRLAVA